MFEIIELLKFNPIPENPDPGKTYEFEYTWGAMKQNRVLGTSLVKFTVGERVLANTIFKGLKGDAVTLNGERTVKGSITERSRIVLLIDYGLVIQQEINTAYAKMKYELVDIDI